MESLPDAQPEVPGTPMAPQIGLHNKWGDTPKTWQVSGKKDEPVDLGIPMYTIMYTLFWDQSLWRSNQTFLAEISPTNSGSERRVKQQQKWFRLDFDFQNGTCILSVISPAITIILNKHHFRPKLRLRLVSAWAQDLLRFVRGQGKLLRGSWID